MRKWILLAGMSMAGVVLAFALLAGTNTGGEVAESSRAPVNTVPVADPVGSAKPILGRPGANPDGSKPAMRQGGNGVNPIAAEGQQRRAQPDAVAAGRASAPWSLVRRTILKNDDEFSKQLLEESATIIADLRQARRDPDSVDFAELEKRQMDLAVRVRESQVGANPTLVGALDRLDTIYSDYHEQIGE